MEEEVRRSIGKLAVQNNNKAWEFFSKNSITAEDTIIMLEAAYTSLHL